jgi:Mrp family chromosome partitioning ATPase
MSKYFQAAQRSNAPRVVTPLNDLTPSPAVTEPGRFNATAREPGSSVVRQLAQEAALRRLSEQVAALSVVDGPVRVLVTGCRPGDGASTVAAALAVDLSQRLAARTALVECHLRQPTPKTANGRTPRETAELVAGFHIPLRSSTWPRLDTVAYSVAPDASLAQQAEIMAELLNPYQVAVVDVGVVRLEAQMLTIARPKDPVVIVARYRQTERQDLTGTVNTIRVTERKIAGVVLNGFNSPVPALFRRLLGIGG